MRNDPFDFRPGQAALMVWRGVRLRCPNCGGGRLFRRWLWMKDSCPTCHLKLDRGENDYFLGGFTLNFIGAELTIVLGALIAVVFTWPNPPWRTIEWSLYGLMLTFPVFTYPIAKTVWLALDLIFRPLTLEDLEGHGELERASHDD